MSISDLIDHIASQSFAKAEPMFHDILNDKIQDSLEAEKAAIATAMFGEEEPNEEPEEDDTDFTDEELEEIEEDDFEDEE